MFKNSSAKHYQNNEEWIQKKNSKKNSKKFRKKIRKKKELKKSSWKISNLLQKFNLNKICSRKLIQMRKEKTYKLN